jgi:hypothetical protein
MSRPRKKFTSAYCFLIAIIVSIFMVITYFNINVVSTARLRIAARTGCLLERAASNVTNEINTSPSCGNVRKIFVLSLKSRPDRQLISSYVWSKLKDKSKCRLPDVTLVEAFDRNELQNSSVVKYLYKTGLERIRTQYEGIAGVYLAHYQLWLHLNTTYPNATVLIAEDDQDAFTYSMDMLDEVLSNQKLPENWHVLWLASTKPDNLDSKGRISLNIFRTLTTEIFYGTWVYILSPAGVRQLLHLHRRAMTERIEKALDLENLEFIRQRALESYHLLPKLFEHLPRNVVKTSIPESGHIEHQGREMDILEPLYAANKSQGALAAPLLAMRTPPLPWEPINASCWAALHSP